MPISDDDRRDIVNRITHLRSISVSELYLYRQMNPIDEMIATQYIEDLITTSRPDKTKINYSAMYWILLAVRPLSREFEHIGIKGLIDILYDEINKIVQGKSDSGINQE